MVTVVLREGPDPTAFLALTSIVGVVPGLAPGIRQLRVDDAALHHV